MTVKDVYYSEFERVSEQMFGIFEDLLDMTVVGQDYKGLLLLAELCELGGYAQRVVACLKSHDEFLERWEVS